MPRRKTRSAAADQPKRPGRPLALGPAGLASQTPASQSSVATWVVTDDVSECSSDSDDWKAERQTVDTGAADQPWSERFAPLETNELAVHPKKVAQVRQWLVEALQKRARTPAPVLMLTGPAGAGKTATVTCLCRQLGVELVEWHGVPDGGRCDADGFRGESEPTQFAAFLARAGQACGLEFGESAASVASRAKRVVLVEDLPLLWHVDSRARIYDAYRQHVFGRAGAHPLILIVSDATADDEPGQFATTTPRNALPKDVLNCPSCTEIAFNPVATTFLQRGLTRVVTAAFKGNARVPGEALLRFVADAAAGDLRFAVNALEFALRTVTGLEPLLESRALTARRTPRKRARVAFAENPAVASALVRVEPVVARRMESSALYHAVGTILNNKRSNVELPAAADTAGAACKKPPVTVETLVASAGVSADVFIDFILENHVAYTGGDPAASAWISDAQLLASRPAFGKRVLDGDAMALAARGLFAVLQKRVNDGHAPAQRAATLTSPWTFREAARRKEFSRIQSDLAVEHGALAATQKTLTLETLPFLARIRSATSRSDDSPLSTLCRFYRRPISSISRAPAIVDPAAALLESFSDVQWYELVDDIVTSGDEEFF